MDKAQSAYAAFQEAGIALDSVARPYFCDGRYGVMRAIERDESLPRAVTEAFNAYHATGMAWARARGF
jgi:DNA gyrase inhibitor GyrI